MDIQEVELQIEARGFNQKQLKIQAKCVGNKVSTLACNNKNCSQSAFVCNEKSCECRIKHKKCLFTDIDQIIQLIQDKQSESTVIINSISTVLENWIDQISKNRQKIQSMLKDYGLSPAERTFINLVKDHKQNQLTGCHIHQITTKTIEYFTEQTKEKLITQIDAISKNYDSEIKSIMNTMTQLFVKFQIDENQTGFNDNNNVKIQIEEDLLPKFQKKLKQFPQPQKKQHYDQFIIFMKQTLKEDFQNHMKKYKQSRRVYGTKKLRQKYFEDYFTALNKGQKYIKVWQTKTKEQLNQLNQFITKKYLTLCNFYRESDGLIEKPFTSQNALSLQKTINTIYMLADFIKLNGKSMVRGLIERNKQLKERFQAIMYFLDALMDQHPEIDEIDTVWNVIRYEEKVKGEVNFLYQVIEQAFKDPYKLQIECEKNQNQA